MRTHKDFSITADVGRSTSLSKCILEGVVFVVRVVPLKPGNRFTFRVSEKWN